MAKGKRLNNKGADDKVKALRALVRVFDNLALDGIGYFSDKLANEVMNKDRNSPSGQVGGGYIRRKTGILMGDTAIPSGETKNGTSGTATQGKAGQAHYVFSMNTGGESRGYAMKVWEWSRKKYGLTPYGIVRGKYTKHFRQGVIDAVKDFVSQWKLDPAKYKYYNPFDPDAYEGSITMADA
jgi:hypothetical protein